MKAIKENQQLLIHESLFLGGTGKMFLLSAALYLGTAFSLGIAYPWLSCLLYKWEIDNTIINGKRLHFDGKGGELFKKYIKWLCLVIVTIGIYKLWLSRNVLMWKISHTHFEGEKQTPSFYKCTISEKLLMLITYYAIVILTLTLGKSVAYCYKTCWTLNHTYINGIQLNFNGKALQYLGECLLCLLFTVITLGIYAFFVPVRMKCWEVRHTSAALSPF